MTMIEWLIGGGIAVGAILGSYLGQLRHYDNIRKFTNSGAFLKEPCPKGVTAPVYEVCQAAVGNPRLFKIIETNRSCTVLYGYFWDYLIKDSFGVTYSIKHTGTDDTNTKFWLTNIEFPTPTPKSQLQLTSEECGYIDRTCKLVANWHKERKTQLIKIQDIRSRRKLTKLYRGDI